MRRSERRDTKLWGKAMWFTLYRREYLHGCSKEGKRLRWPEPEDGLEGLDRLKAFPENASDSKKLTLHVIRDLHFSAICTRLWR